MSTFIALHRKIEDSFVYQDSGLLHLWIHCLVKASYKDRVIMFDGAEIQLKRGEFITGRKSLSKTLRTTEKKIRLRLVLLEKHNQITIKRASKYSLISVVKYDYYQSDETKRASRGPAEGQQRATNNKDNKDNNIGEPSSQEPLKDNQKDMGWKNNQGDEPDIPDVDMDTGEVIKLKQKAKRHYKEVYDLFKTLSTIPLNWTTNTTQQNSAENLYTERGVEQIISALQYYKEHKGEEYLPEINSPWDLDSKWKKLHNFKKKNG